MAMWDIFSTGLALGGPIASYYGQKEANETNMAIHNSSNQWNDYFRKEQQKFQERMSNTAISRAAADAKSAGFNPLIALGNPASSPSGASASAASAAPMQNEMEGIASGALDLAQLTQNIRRTNADIGLTKDQQGLTKAQTAKTLVDAEVARKGIPESEIKNDIYDLIRPGVKKIKQMFDSNSRSINQPKYSPEMQKQFDDFHEKYRRINNEKKVKRNQNMNQTFMHHL